MRLRVSLKKFLRLPRNFSSDVLTQIFPIDFIEWVESEHANSTSKWEARLNRCVVKKQELMKYEIPRMRNLPLEFNKLLKYFVAWCDSCEKSFYPEHLSEHGVKRVRIKEMFEDLENIRSKLFKVVDVNGKPARVCREDIMMAYCRHLQDVIREVEAVLKVHARKFFSSQNKKVL